MDGDADGARLLGNRTIDGLPDPPGCIRTELEAAPRVELSDRTQKPHGTLLDQVLEWDAAPEIALGNTDNQAQVGSAQRLAGFDRAGLDRMHFIEQVFI